jgi:hypothetical protein
VIPSRALRLTMLSLVLLAPGLAWAQAGNADHEADEQFRLGLEAEKHGHAEEARLHFVESYAVDAQPNTLWNLALAEAQSNHPLDALRHLRQWLGGPKVTPANKEVAQKVVRDMLVQTGHIAVSGVAVDAVVIDGNDASSLVQENGVFDVMPGHHVVEARGAAGKRKTEANVTAGRTVNVRFETEPEKAVLTPPAPTASASTNASPVTAITEAPHAEPTEHRSFWTTRKVVVVSLGAAAAVALGVGVGFGVASQNDNNALVQDRSSPSCSTGCNQLANDIHSQRNDSQLANGMYIGSAVLAVGAIGVLASILIAPARRSSEQTSIAPLLLVGGGGISMNGRF